MDIKLPIFDLGANFDSPVDGEEFDELQIPGSNMFDRPIGHQILTEEQLLEDQFNFVPDQKSDAKAKEIKLKELSNRLRRDQLKKCNIKVEDNDYASKIITIHDPNDIQIIDYQDEKTPEKIQDYDLNTYSSKLHSSSSGLISQSKSQPAKTQLDLQNQRKAMTINFIQNNYTHKDHRMIHDVINKSYQNEIQDDYANFSIGSKDRQENVKENDLTIGFQGRSMEGLELESRNGNEITQMTPEQSLRCSTKKTQEIKQIDKTQSDKEWLKTQQKKDIERQFYHIEKKRKQRAQQNNSLDTPLSALNPELENKRTEKFINNLLYTGCDNTAIEQRRQLNPDEQRKKEIQKKVAQIMTDQTMKQSKFFIQAEKKRQDTEAKIRRFRKKIQYYQDTNHWEKTQKRARAFITEFRKERLVTRTWIHVDMDMFFAQVEIRDNPKLGNVPVAVGNSAMCQTSNYIARQYGVKAGMPGYIAKKLIPDLIFIMPDYVKYKIDCEKIRKVLEAIDPEFESLGYDEASLDVTDYLRINNLETKDGRLFVAQKIKDDIFNATKLTSSCGVGCNKMVAKMCSSVNKPDGITYLGFTQRDVDQYIFSQPIGKVPGIGKFNQMILNGLGIFYCQDLIDKCTEVFVNYSSNAFEFMMKAGMGIYRTVHEYNIQKSLGVSSTFAAIYKEEEFVQRITACAKELSERINDCRLVFRSLCMEMKTTEFEMLQRGQTLKYYIYREKDIVQQSLRIYENMKPIKDGIRLIGIRVTLLRDRDVCKKERIFGPERDKARHKMGAGRAKYRLDEDPDELSAQNGKPIEMPEDKDYDENNQEFDFSSLAEDNDFSAQEQQQIKQMQTDQEQVTYGDKKNNCRYQQALYKFCRARMNQSGRRAVDLYRKQNNKMDAFLNNRETKNEKKIKEIHQGKVDASYFRDGIDRDNRKQVQKSQEKEDQEESQKKKTSYGVTSGSGLLNFRTTMSLNSKDAVDNETQVSFNSLKTTVSQASRDISLDQLLTYQSISPFKQKPDDKDSQGLSNASTNFATMNPNYKTKSDMNSFNSLMSPNASGSFRIKEDLNTFAQDTLLYPSEPEKLSQSEAIEIKSQPVIQEEDKVDENDRIDLMDQI